MTACLTATLARQRPDRIDVRALNGAQEARLIALPCPEAPAGADHCRLRLLADALGRWAVVETIFLETIRQTLNKTR